MLPPASRVDDKSSAVRPAFNLNLSSVLFTSAAAGGKSAGANGLAAVADYSGSDWKLTLLDSSRTFAVSNAMLGGNTVTFSYSGAQTGVNEYLSAVIMDQNGTIAYYGRILQPTSASGTASLTLPSGVTLSDTTKLYVFNEQYNGDKRTDYASALCQVTPETLQAPSVIITALPGGKVGEAYSRTLAARGSVPITWSLESGSLPAGLTLSGNTISGTPTAAGTFTFTVKASNAAGSDSRELSIVIASVPVDPDPDSSRPSSSPPPQMRKSPRKRAALSRSACRHATRASTSGMSTMAAASRPSPARRTQTVPSRISPRSTTDTVIIAL